MAVIENHRLLLRGSCGEMIGQGDGEMTDYVAKVVAFHCLYEEKILNIHFRGKKFGNMRKF